MEEKPKDCGTCGEGDCAAKRGVPGEKKEQQLERQAIARRMCRIRHKVLVMSGKGGVGKTTVAVNLAWALAREGRRVGIMDVDIHGPNVPKMLGAENALLGTTERSILPAEAAPNLKVMSVALLLRQDSDAVIWRGPLKMGLIKQLLRDVDWGDLDVLVIDAPPGTGDEPLSVVQLIGDLDGAVIVTTPQEMSILDVRKSITFCRQVRLEVLGIVENMRGFVCPHCGKRVDILGSGGGEALARELGIDFLGAVPIEADIAKQADRGRTVLEVSPASEAARAFQNIMKNLEQSLQSKKKS
jgi:ATP-binding protein involved in chromosome partitioning